MIRKVWGFSGVSVGSVWACFAPIFSKLISSNPMALDYAILHV